MVRYFFLSLNVLNGLLALAVAVVAYYVAPPLLNPDAGISLPPVKETVSSSGEQTAPSRPFPVADYAVISDQNLFHPGRKIPLEKQPEKVIIPKPEVFLYGTLITSDASYAFIEDKKTPYSTPGRGKRQTTLKKGDSLNGYIVSEIEADRIVLVKGDEKVAVMLDDKGKRRADDSPAAPATARTAASGLLPSPSAAPSSPKAASASSEPVGPGPATPPPPQPSIPSPPRLMQPSTPDTLPSKPGIGGSGTWPPTRDSVEQTRQKLKEAQQMRIDQLKRSQ